MVPTRTAVAWTGLSKTHVKRVWRRLGCCELRGNRLYGCAALLILREQVKKRRGWRKLDLPGEPAPSQRRPGAKRRRTKRTYFCQQCARFVRSRDELTLFRERLVCRDCLIGRDERPTIYDFAKARLAAC